jgi:hypothetical protein
MPRGHNLKLSDVHDTYDPASGGIEKTEERLAATPSGNVDARHLQSLLIEAYAETSPEEKLPAAHRVAIIVGITSALWLSIGIAIYVAF